MQQTLGKSSDDVLSTPIEGGRGLSTRQRHEIDLSSTIRGWGSDLDMSRRPGVPMDAAPGIGSDTLYPAIEQQVPRARVHKSTEHGKFPPVFGDACPPRGLSGLIRDFAYGLSEGRLTRWMLLVAADRVDMVEELFVDLSRFEIPNIPKEMGLASELKYNRKGVATKLTAVAGMGLIAFMAISKRRDRRASRSSSRGKVRDVKLAA